MIFVDLLKLIPFETTELNGSTVLWILVVILIVLGIIYLVRRL